MPLYGVGFSEAPLDFASLFGRTAPTILEIGFGMGDTTAQIASDHPDWNFLGVEVHTPGVGALMKLTEQRGLRNVRVIEHDAQAVLAHQIPDESLTGIHIFFPDPWPKARHHKRRLIQQHLVTCLYRALRRGGYLHMATDWPDYADQMRAVVDATPGLLAPSESTAGPVAGSEREKDVVARAARPITKFERRGLRLGHPISDIVRIKTGADPATK